MANKYKEQVTVLDNLYKRLQHCLNDDDKELVAYALFYLKCQPEWKVDIQKQKDNRGVS